MLLFLFGFIIGSFSGMVLTCCVVASGRKEKQ